MRKGILSDSNNHVFEVPSMKQTEALFGGESTKLQKKHDMIVKKRKHAKKIIQRPIAAYMAHHEFSQLLSPNHSHQYHDAFEAHAEKIYNQVPKYTFRGEVEKFVVDNPAFQNKRSLLPETAFLFGKLGLDPSFFNTIHNNPSPTITKVPLHKIYNELKKTIPPDQIPELETTYNEAMNNLISGFSINHPAGRTVDMLDRANAR